jgi:ferric-dicitrate binding protein FerR (iron transport regulator)
MLEQPHTRRRQPRRRRSWPSVLALAVAIVLAFALGLALGQALDDGPEPGATVTSVRTLEPLPQQPTTTP